MLTTGFIRENYPPVPGLPYAWRVPLDYARHPGARPYSFAYRPSDYNSPPAVSVVTAFYGGHETLPETARSIFTQSLQRFEWLIVDDGNTDRRALAALEALSAADPRTRVIRRRDNGGPGAARNTGMREAQAEYVCFLDSDDVMEPTSLEKLLWRMHTWPALAFARGWSVGFGAECYVLFTGFQAGNLFLSHNVASISALMIRPAALKGRRFDESLRSGLEDWEFWLRCADAGIWGGGIFECCDWYRRRPTHADRWPAYTGEYGGFLAEMRAKFPGLWRPGAVFPRPAPPEGVGGRPSLPSGEPAPNELAKTSDRFLILADDMDDLPPGLITAMGGFIRGGGELSLIATGNGPRLTGSLWYALTPDVFALSNFLHIPHYSAFIEYFLRSRRPDAVLVCGRAPGVLACRLRDALRDSLLLIPKKAPPPDGFGFRGAGGGGILEFFSDFAPAVFTDAAAYAGREEAVKEALITLEAGYPH